MREWLLSLLLPWDQLAERWATATAIAVAFDGLIAAAAQAESEWWPTTCRTETLTVWGNILGRPRRPGETIETWRQRLAWWRREPVGTRGWVLDELQRITGAGRMIEMPHDAMVWGASRWNDKRWGVSAPVLVVGAPTAQRAIVFDHFDREIPPDCGLYVLDADHFDRI